jgi:hypothetical protein
MVYVCGKMGPLRGNASLSWLLKGSNEVHLLRAIKKPSASGRAKG